jgi:hypothetical protein
MGDGRSANASAVSACAEPRRSPSSWPTWTSSRPSSGSGGERAAAGPGLTAHFSPSRPAGLAPGPGTGAGTALLRRAQVRPPGPRRWRPGPAQPGGGLADLSGARAQGGNPGTGTHHLRRTWIADLFDLGVDLATVQKMARHASVLTTGRYDRRNHAVQRRAASQLQVRYVQPEE